MSLLQHPSLALKQIEWYLDNRRLESFPGAFLLAAGNLARQVLEQVVFILAFYSDMPRHKYLKTSGQLRRTSEILETLKSVNPASGRTFLDHARQKGPRIRKFARNPCSLDRWRRLLNEPSHFSNPAAGRKVIETHIRHFVRQFGAVFEHVDGYLITAAVNQIRSGGVVRAVLGSDPENIPGVQCDVIVTPNDIEFADGTLSLKGKAVPVQVVPDSQEVPLRWSKRVVVVQHSHGMRFGMRLITRSGVPLDLTNFKTVLDTFTKDPRDRRILIRRMKHLGIPFKVVRSAG